MPSKSTKQRNFMAAVAHNPAFAKKVGVPTSVGKDFSKADKGRKFSKGGTMAKSDMKEDMKMDLKQDKSMMQKAVNKHEGRLHKGAAMTKLSSGGYTKAANGIASKGKTKGTQIKMSKGGKAC